MLVTARARSEYELWTAPAVFFVGKSLTSNYHRHRSAMEDTRFTIGAGIPVH
jgi:hypothetical protein